MIRRVDIKNQKQNFKAILYKNRREALCEIPNEYISNVKRVHEDIDTFELKIPKYIPRQEKKVINPVYLKIKSEQQIIVKTIVAGEEVLERFIVKEAKRLSNKNSGDKRFKVYSFEHTLKGKRTSFDGKVIQLKTDNIHLSEGIMDKFSRETGWGIDYVDPKARVETMSTTEKKRTTLFTSLTKNNIQSGELIFEKDIITTIADNRPLYVTFYYNKLKTYSDEKLLIEIPSIENTITDALHLNIRKIQAYHYSDTGNRFGIRYVFTLSDNTTVERITTFSNIVNKSIECSEIQLVWETGDLIETENVKYINIESLDDTWYNCLISLQENFNSVFFFDSYNKKISIIHRDNVGTLMPYVLSYDNSLIDIDISEKDVAVTGLKVVGKDGLTILSENIYGDDIVRDYSAYKRTGNLSYELESALDRYEALLITKQSEWNNIKSLRLDETLKRTRIDSEIISLNERIKNLKNLLAGFVAGGGGDGQSSIKNEIDDLQSRLNQCNSLVLQYKINIESYDDLSALISEEIKREKAVDNNGTIFDSLLLEELNDIEYIESYEDSYYSNSYSLLLYSKKNLAERIKPQIDFNISCYNLAKSITNPLGWNYVLELGGLFKFDDDSILEETGEDSVRFVSYTYDPSTNTVSGLTFTNKYKVNSEVKKLANLNNKNTTSTSLMNSLKPIIDDAKLSNNFAREVREHGLDLAAYVARGNGASNFIDISEAGIYLYDQSNMNNAVYIGSSVYCITTDGFATSKTAITPDGVIADTIIGRLLIGEELIITTDDGHFSIGGYSNGSFGLLIKDSLENGQRDRIFLGTEVDNDGIRRAKLRLISKDGKEVVLDENGIIQTSQFLCWDNLSKNYPMRIPYVCDEGVSSNKKILMTLIFEKYRAFERGMSSGGEKSTSSSGGGGTSGSGGGQTSSSGGGGTSSHGGALNLEVFTGRGTFENHEATVRMTKYPDDYYIDGDINSHGHIVTTSQLKHTHEVILKSDSHTHTVSNHTHTVSDHTHQIDNHSHTLDTSHNHQLEYSIHEQDSLCSNVKVYVNDILVREKINKGVQIDLTSYIKINSVNDIRIETDTNGRITCNMFTKAFVSF